MAVVALITDMTSKSLITGDPVHKLRKHRNRVITKLHTYLYQIS